jgi:hypothetical protein
MSLIVPQEGEKDALSAFIAAVLDGVKLRLFVTSIALGPATTLSSLLAAEASFSGYSPNVLTVWSTPTIDGTGRAATMCTQPSFTGTAGGGTGGLYGYFYTDSGGTKLYGAETFAGGPLSFAQNVAFDFDVTYTFLSQS